MPRAFYSLKLHLPVPTALLAITVLISLTGCLENPTSTGVSGSESGTSAEIIPPIPEDVAQADPLVCDALNSPTHPAIDSTYGLTANLFYLEPSQPRFTTVHDYISLGQPVSGYNIFFNQVNIPTRPFDRGFQTNEGATIKNSQGNTLYEYFALEFKSDLVLKPTDLPGDYQFALLADDGAVLSHRGSNGLPIGDIVNDDGVHSTKFACATSPITMDYDSRLPINLRYYQGPRYHIAMMILYRPWPTDPALVNDVECGKMGNSRYFDSTQNPPQPSATYNNLLARGWKVLEPDHYKLPSGIENSCNIPAPIISSIRTTSVLQTSAVITWSTDINSTSQIEYTDVSAGITVSTPVDTKLVTSHSVTLSNLKPYTLYTATVISNSVSGKSTRGTELTFRTRR